MKKSFLLTLFLVTSQLFAQDTLSTSVSRGATHISQATGFDIAGTLMIIFFYFLLPIIFYCISSYSLGLLNKHYNKKASSGVSWVPFVRYYVIIKTATKSAKKAFIITLLPWIVATTVLAGGAIVILIAINISLTTRDWIAPAMIIFGIMLILGMLLVMVMNFWRAFILSKYVKGDTTTALGLSTYTAIVLWYVALDRVQKNTNIIGNLGFILIGLMACFYVAILFVFGFSGLTALLGN